MATTRRVVLVEAREIYALDAYIPRPRFHQI